MASKIHLYALFFSFFILGIHAVTITVKNSCSFTIWPATQTPPGGEAASLTGFELAQGGAPKDIEVPPTWSSGRIWARTGCSVKDGKLTCTIGECGGLECNGNGGNPPVSLAEFTLTGNNNQDNYDISLVDGFNLPLKITPSNGKCRTLSCQANINDGCPAGLAIDGGCKSACLAFGDDKYCCKGAFSTADTCPPSDFSNYFKGKCPDAYSYAYDDRKSLFTCSPGGVTNYVVEFCP